MKTQTYGVSHHTSSIVCMCCFPYFPPHDLCVQAVKNYIVNRQNGEAIDNPSKDFPNDGKYTWETPGEKVSKVLYLPGPKDRAWMDKKDRNYVMRLVQEGKLKSYEPDLETEVPELYKEIQEEKKVGFMSSVKPVADMKVIVEVKDQNRGEVAFAEVTSLSPMFSAREIESLPLKQQEFVGRMFTLVKDQQTQINQLREQQRQLQIRYDQLQKQSDNSSQKVTSGII